MLEFWLCFVPIFVAVDAIGILPLYLGFTQGLPKAKSRKILYQSITTAAVVSLFFMFLGQAIFNLLGISISDFMIAGGALLFVIAMSDLLAHEKKLLPADPDSLGAVPIGVPLIVGPGVLTTSMILVGEYGFIYTGAALLSNILITGIIFFFSEQINRLLGKSGAKTVSKLASLLIAAIAVMMIRKGVMLLVKG